MTSWKIFRSDGNYATIELKKKKIKKMDQNLGATFFSDKFRKMQCR